MIPPKLIESLERIINDDINSPEKYLQDFEIRLDYISFHRKDYWNEVEVAISMIQKENLFPSEIDLGYLRDLIESKLDIDLDSYEIDELEIPPEINLEENEEN